MSDDVKEKIKNLIADHVGISKKEITCKSTTESLGLDSLDIVELIMGLEEEFNLDIDDNEVENLKSFKEIVGYITDRLEKRVVQV